LGLVVVLVIIKKWNLILLCSIFMLSILSLGLLVRRSDTKETAAVPGFGKRIIIDAGHGEPDGGAVGNHGVLEKDLNLAISRYLQGYLEQGGVEVILTRSDDSGIYDAENKTIRQKKRSDLKNRENLIKNSEADLFVSIHMNKFSDSKYSGPQVFFSANHKDSKPLAEQIQQEMIAVLKPPSERTVKQAGKEIYLMQKAKIPAVLIECGFLSNDREEQLLMNEEYQKKAAWAIYCGIIKYLASA